MKKENFKGMNKGAGSGAIYGLGIVGALIYFIQHSATAGDVIFGILKSIVWPAILVYKVLELLKL